MKVLTIILPTEAKLSETEKTGLFSRWKFYFSKMKKYFDIEVYSCDTKNFSNKINVKHFAIPISLKFLPYGNQILYNFFLLLSVFRMSNYLRIISASYFILPILKLFGKKIILSYHYDYKTTTEKDFSGIKGVTAGIREYLSIKSSDLVIATTSELQEIIKKRYDKNSILIPNFVDTSKFIPLDKEKYIIYVGRIYWHKGVDYLLEAFSKIEKKYPNYNLKIVGVGDLEKYRKKADDLKIKNVYFLGGVDNSKIPELMGRAEIFILPTVNREGHPKSLIEAMACGCACIVTDVPGNRELVQNEVNGLLVKPKDTYSIVESIFKLLKNNKLKIMLSKNARKTALDFSVENTLHKEISLLKELAKETKYV